MIGYLKGKITHVFANSCFIEVGGVGYRTIVSGTTLGELSVGKETMLYTYMSVTENDITLYGFLTQDEYELFLLLITALVIIWKHPLLFQLLLQFLLDWDVG